MRTLSKPKHLAGLLSASALVLGFALTAQPALGASIKDTKHNLGSSNGNNVNYTTDTRSNGEICVFCHTPHGSDTSAAAPLWNKKLPVGTTYTTYAAMNSTFIDGIIGQPGAISLACLSCHDGAQAMDNIINAPGSGNYDSTGGGAGGRGWTWVGTDQTAGKMANTVAMLGTDLSNDHPVGIEYCGGPVGGVIGTCRDGDFVLPTAATGQMATGPWWVDTADGTAGTREKTDMILFPAGTRGQLSPGVGPQVECASCHDPHSTNGLFLRRMAGNAGSTTCLSCHVK